MNPHQTCGTCIFNVDADCANEASRYHGAPLKSELKPTRITLKFLLSQMHLPQLSAEIGKLVIKVA